MVQKKDIDLICFVKKFRRLSLLICVGAIQYLLSECHLKNTHITEETASAPKFGPVLPAGLSRDTNPMFQDRHIT